MSEPAHPPPGGGHEVRAYLVRLVSLILLGLVIMTTTVVVVWRVWGGQLVDDTTRIPLEPPAAVQGRGASPAKP